MIGKEVCSLRETATVLRSYQHKLTTSLLENESEFQGQEVWPNRAAPEWTAEEQKEEKTKKSSNFYLD